MKEEKIQDSLDDIKESISEIEEEIAPKKGKTRGDPVVSLS